MPDLTRLLDRLEEHYGALAPAWPVDPFLFLVWWHCGYPASDASCARGWEALSKAVRITPEAILRAPVSRLGAALKAGGMVPDLRASRLQEICSRVVDEFGGDLDSALRRMSVAKARAALRKFPGIAEAGADRILLFSGIAAVAAVPSNCPQVLVRIRLGTPGDDWNKSYRAASEIIAAEVPEKPESRRRAYLLLKIHGQSVCKRTKPRCSECVVSDCCAFVRQTPQATGRRRPS